MIDKKQSYSQLLDYFKTKNIVVGLRQLQRDIKELELLLGFDEELIKTRDVNKKLEIQIKKKLEGNNCFTITETGYNALINSDDLQVFLFKK